MGKWPPLTFSRSRIGRVASKPLISGISTHNSVSSKSQLCIVPPPDARCQPPPPCTVLCHQAPHRGLTHRVVFRRQNPRSLLRDKEAPTGIPAVQRLHRGFQQFRLSNGLGQVKGKPPGRATGRVAPLSCG